MKTKIQEESEKFTRVAPKSVCRCGHTGDGANSEHEDSVLVFGHGACRNPGCDCGGFSWKRFTEAFQAILDRYVSRSASS